MDGLDRPLERQARMQTRWLRARRRSIPMIIATISKSSSKIPCRITKAPIRCQHMTQMYAVSRGTNSPLKLFRLGRLPRCHSGGSGLANIQSTRCASSPGPVVGALNVPRFAYIASSLSQRTTRSFRAATMSSTAGSD